MHGQRDVHDGVRCLTDFLRSICARSPTTVRAVDRGRQGARCGLGRRWFVIVVQRGKPHCRPAYNDGERLRCGEKKGKEQNVGSVEIKSYKRGI